MLHTSSAQDPVLITHARCLNEDILCSWKRIQQPLTAHSTHSDEDQEDDDEDEDDDEEENKTEEALKNKPKHEESSDQVCEMENFDENYRVCFLSLKLIFIEIK